MVDRRLDARTRILLVCFVAAAIVIVAIGRIVAASYDAPQAAGVAETLPPPVPGRAGRRSCRPCTTRRYRYTGGADRRSGHGPDTDPCADRCGGGDSGRSDSVGLCGGHGPG